MSGMYSPGIDYIQDSWKGNGDYEEAAAAHNRGREPEGRASVTKPRCLTLAFTNTSAISDHHPVIFTGIPLEKQGLSLKISFVDAANQNRVVADGPESSAAVEIVVLSNDFNFDEQDRAFKDDYNTKIVDADNSLLRENSRFLLKDGTASLSQIFFRHANRHTRVKELRLGARIIRGYIDAPVREATTEPFTLKDRRIKSKKHYPPCLDDEVWRLENIGKNGPFHRRLREKNINTVKNFLAELTKDQENLRNILKMTKTPKRWEMTVKHARTCILSDTVKVLSDLQPSAYRKDGSMSSHHHLYNFWNDPNYLPHEY